MSRLSDNIEKARAASRERLDSAKEVAGERTVVVREKMSESKARAAALLDEGRSKAADGVAATREVAQKAAHKSEETIAKSPLVVVAGGAALGALIGLLLPKSKAEEKYVGETGKRINETAKKAYDAAKEAGQEQFDNLGLNKDSAQHQVKDLFSKLVEAAQGALAAAIDATKSDNAKK